MDLNSGEYKNRQDYDTIAYHQRTTSLNDDILSSAVIKDVFEKEDTEYCEYRDRIWNDVKKVCGGIISVDYIIMYQHIYLGDSFRKICERFGVSHMSIYKRYRKVVQKLQFLYGVETTKIPYKRREGSKL